MSIYSQAWEKCAREFQGTEALRVFHDARIAIEKFGDHYWIFEWDAEGRPAIERREIEEAVQFLREKGAQSIVYLARPHGAVPAASAEILWGTPPEYYDAREDENRFRIRFQNTRHPGLFLDHRPLRQWLRKQMNGRNVLNTFSYTGSLSVAAAQGGASKVTTLDLSKPTIAWAKENWELNGFSPERGDFIYGDYFEWLPRLGKRGEKYDAVILDPPSFSRGNKGNFSTSKDLVRLHEEALQVLAPGGWLITSINSAKLTRDFYRAEIEEAARNKKRRLRAIETLGAPEASFGGANHPLKGWIFQS